MTATLRAPTVFRLAARLARREVLRRPGRTILVALLVALPVAGMLAAAVTIRTGHPSASTRWRLDNGAADSVFEPPADVRPVVPEGSRSISYNFDEFRVMRTSDGRSTRGALSNAPFTDPILDGTVDITSGRAPSATNEVFLTRRLARKLRVEVGDSIDLARPTVFHATVVGIGERRGQYDTNALYFAPGTAWWGDQRVPATATLVQLPTSLSRADTDAWWRSVEGDGVAIRPGLGSYQPPRDTSGSTNVRWSWVIGAAVLAVIGIVIASAFAAGARRQLTTLGQLAANGASPRVLRRMLALQGTWNGLVGAVVGLGIGALALRIFRHNAIAEI